MGTKRTRIQRLKDFFKNIKLPDIVTKAKANNTPELDAKRDKAQRDSQLQDAGLDPQQVGEHNPDKTAEQRVDDSRAQAESANDAANLSQAEADVVSPTSEIILDAGAAAGGKITPADLELATAKGIEIGRQKAIEDFRALSDPSARQRAVDEANSTLDNIEPDGIIKKTMGGLWLGIKQLRLGFALLLAAIAGLAYFGYKLDKYARCMRVFRENFRDVLDDKGDLENELEKSTADVQKCFTLNSPAGTGSVRYDANQLCVIVQNVNPASIAASTSLPSSVVPDKCNKFLERWCKLQEAQEALRVCQNEMPLSGVLEGALEFLRQAAKGVLDVALDLGKEVVQAGAEAAKEAASGLFSSGILIVLAIAAVVVFVMLRRRR